ncbi:MAG: GTPase [Bacteroidota bacterium]|nr:GTPase [Christiangramia sp.]MEE2772021.1 GTPase [Bacteroidota bacterium]
MEKIIFVYNATSGKANAFLDSLHKIMSPATYECPLCQLTHGPVSEKRRWKEFRENLSLETEFLHRDEFQKSYASKFGYQFEFPVILMAQPKGLELLVSAAELRTFENVEELIRVLNERI